MEKVRKVELLAEILDVEQDEIEDGRKLADIGDWNSLAVLSFIAMMDEEFGKEVNGATIKGLVTVSDAFALMEE